MAKPLSLPYEIGRAVGYKVDVDLLLEKLKQAPLGELNSLKSNHAFLEQLERVAKMHGGSVEHKPIRRLWVVVKTEKGIPVMIDAYRDKRSASKREKFLRMHMHPESNDVVLVEIKL